MEKIQEYLKGLEIGGESSKSSHTIRLYKKDLNKFQSFFNLQSLTELQALTISDFQRFYQSTNLSGNSLNSLIRSLSAFFKWLAEDEIVSEKYSFFKVRFGGKKLVKVIKKDRVSLTIEESEKLIKAGRDIQERFMLALMIFNGLRRKEICEIKLSDLSGCHVTIHSKGGSIDKVLLNETLCTLLNIYLSQRDSDSEYLFFSTRGEVSKSGELTGTSVNNRVKSAGKRAGIAEDKLKGLTAHSLRRTCGTNMIVQFNLDTAMRVLRHKSIETTRIYDNSKNIIADRALENQITFSI